MGEARSVLGVFLHTLVYVDTTYVEGHEEVDIGRGSTELALVFENLDEN